jgi:superfamily II DNA or RNA helicase
MKTLRDYQEDLSRKAVEILKDKGIVYLAMEVRCGKTATAMNTALLYGARRVLFLTKKKAISSIEDDLNEFGFDEFFDIFTITNDESLHKVEDDYDLVIHDEHHRFGAFPKMGATAKLFRQKYSHLPMIFLSGTPHPESYSQVFHQFHVSKNSPFNHKNFYIWAKEFVRVKDRHLAHAVVKDYSDAMDYLINPIIKPYMVTFTQAQAGFTTTIKEHVLYCAMEDKIARMIKQLINDRVIEGKQEVILADTGVKLQQKVHQLSSGTVIFESGNSKVLSHAKAEFIRDTFKAQKIAIFYKFKSEWQALKDVFGDLLTGDLEEFNSSNKNIALQIVSGREGISLKNATSLVYYNIDFSAVSYWQSRDRLTTMERMTNDVYWIFSKGGIEEKIYRTVNAKKDYTLNVFKKDYGK